MGVELKGVDEFVKKLEKTKRLEGVQKVVKKHAASVQKHAMQHAPVDTGFLKQHIMPPVLTDRGLTAEITSTAEYSAYLEYGTRFMKAQPYMRPALEAVNSAFMKELQEAMFE